LLGGYRRLRLFNFALLRFDSPMLFEQRKVQEEDATIAKLKKDFEQPWRSLLRGSTSRQRESKK